MGALIIVRRLVLGLCLITVTAAVLLWSDRGSRQAEQTGTESSSKPQPGRVYRLGIGYFAPDEGADMVFKGLFEELAAAGFVKDQNLQVTFKHANAEIPMIPAVLQSLDDGSMDLIVALTTPCLAAACKSVRQTQVVFTYVYDPLAAGAGKSFTDHLPHITGVGSFPPLEETIDVMLKVKPGLKAVGTLYNSSEANSVKVISVARELFQKKGIRLEEVTVTGTNEVFQAADVVASRNVEALWVTGDNTALQAFDAIGKVAGKHKLPLFINDPEFTQKGALAAIGIGWYQTGRRSGKVAARVLLGGKTSEIPIENYAEKKVVLNQEQAKKLGLSFPEDVARMATPTEQKKLNFYLVSYADTSNVEESERGIIDAFKDAGLVDTKDYTLTRRNAQGDVATLNAIVDAAIAERPDVLFALCTPALQTTVKKVRDGNVVFGCVADPIAAGAGKSYTDHLPNFAGVSVEADFDGLLRLLKASMPARQADRHVVQPVRGQFGDLQGETGEACQGERARPGGGSRVPELGGPERRRSAVRQARGRHLPDLGQPDRERFREPGSGRAKGEGSGDRNEQRPGQEGLCLCRRRPRLLRLRTTDGGNWAESGARDTRGDPPLRSPNQDADSD